MSKKRNRFVGMASFTEKEHDIFFGREADIDRLATLIQIEKLVVLFSKSGVGKSSLLRAGIEPRLQEKGFYPLRVRFFNYTANQETYVSPSQVLENVAGEWQTGTFLDDLIPPTFRNSTWAKFKLLQVQAPERIILLLMDQFEELSTHPAEEVMWFKFQLADMLQTKLPKSIEKYMAETHSLTDEQMNLLYAPIPLRVVISLRSDYLSFLQQFRDVIPFILNKTYELNALTQQTAQEALLKPTEKEDSNFTTPRFQIAPDALQKILQELSGAGKQIESFQLQTVGSEIEKIMIDKRKDTPDYQELALQDLPDLQNLWSEFYDHTILSLPAEHQAQARELIEEHLVQQGKRISLDEIICKQILPDAESLKILVDNRLLRIESNNTQGFSYEVSHDTLIKPIIEKLEKKQAQRKETELKALLIEAKEKEKKERQEKEKKERESKRNKRLFHIATIAFCIALVTVAFSIFFYLQAKKDRDLAVKSWEKAQRSERKADMSKALAFKSRDKAEKKQKEADESAKIAFQKEEEAKISEQKAHESELKAKINAQKVLETLQKLEKNQAISKAKELEGYGDSYVDLGKRDFACESYETALKTLKNYPQTPEYQAIQQKRKTICNP